MRTKREDKRFAMNSVEIDREVGGEVQEALGFEVDLSAPELTISIEIMNDAAYVSAGKMPGAGGLPVGVTGRGMALLSGGIDSPVAAHRMMRRGLRLDFVHFHAHPLVSAASREKAAELAAHLTRWQVRSTLMLVPFGNLQREIVANTLRPLRVILYRRFMLRIASALAERSNATVLVTGESLGQVASQTLENMAVIEKASSFPVMRPLVGMDKNEIIDQARRLRTFETSILPGRGLLHAVRARRIRRRARESRKSRRRNRASSIPRMIEDARCAPPKIESGSESFPPRATKKAAVWSVRNPGIAIGHRYGHSTQGRRKSITSSCDAATKDPARSTSTHACWRPSFPGATDRADRAHPVACGPQHDRFGSGQRPLVETALNVDLTYALGSRLRGPNEVASYLRARSVEVIGEPAMRYGAHGQGLSIYVRDPEGNVVELKQMPIEDEFDE